MLDCLATSGPNYDVGDDEGLHLVAIHTVDYEDHSVAGDFRGNHVEGEPVKHHKVRVDTVPNRHASEHSWRPLTALQLLVVLLFGEG